MAELCDWEVLWFSFMSSHLHETSAFVVSALVCPVCWVLKKHCHNNILGFV